MGHGTAFAFSLGMMAAQPILLQELSGQTSEWSSSRGTSLLELAEESAVVLRFQIRAADLDSLEALRHARRSILREEWTRGRDEEEPSLEDAIFSPTEIIWPVRPEQKEWCRQKLEDLVARANRCLLEFKPA